MEFGGLYLNPMRIVSAASAYPSNYCPQQVLIAVATRSVFYPDTEDVVGWDTSGQGFKIMFSPGVPDMVRLHLESDQGLAAMVTGFCSELVLSGW